MVRKRKYCHPSHVLVLYDYNAKTTAATDGDTVDSQHPYPSPPSDVDKISKLSLERGEVLKVLSESLDWWIVCESPRTGESGYVCTHYCTPFKPR